MALVTWFASMAITPNYIMYKIGLEDKKYGIKISSKMMSKFTLLDKSTIKQRPTKCMEK
jgi:hypothetical protein